MKILFLAANPSESAQLNLAKEIRSIDDALQRSKLKEEIKLVSKWAVNSNVLRRALFEEDPDIVHFSGHGEGQAGLVLEDQNGQAKPATGEALAGLFREFSNIRCVVLNACFAEVQAKAIVEHVDYVVGMKQAVRDDAAIAFATGFYDSLGYGIPVESAFNLGRNAIQFEQASFSQTTRKLIPVAPVEDKSLPDHLIPVLLRRKMSSAERLSRSTRLTSEVESLAQRARTLDNATKADIYRERVREFLSDHQLTKLDRSQLATLANALRLSEQEANRILQEEQNKQFNEQSTTTQRSWLPRIDTKKFLIGCAAFLAVAGGYLIHSQLGSTNGSNNSGNGSGNGQPSPTNGSNNGNKSQTPTSIKTITVVNNVVNSRIFPSYQSSRTLEWENLRSTPIEIGGSAVVKLPSDTNAFKIIFNNPEEMPPSEWPRACVFDPSKIKSGQTIIAEWTDNGGTGPCKIKP